MSILGVGTDIVAVGRMADLLRRHGDRFLARCYGAAERQVIAERAPVARAATAAGRWAAKEAFLKALGGSIAHIPYHDISVVAGPAGAPSLVLTGAAAAAFAACRGRRCHLSISHERDYAVATVLIET